MYWQVASSPLDKGACPRHQDPITLITQPLDLQMLLMAIKLSCLLEDLFLKSYLWCMRSSQTPPREAPSGILGAEWRLERQSRSWGTLMKGRAGAEGASLIINILAQQGSVPELRSLSLAAMKDLLTLGRKYSNTCIPTAPPKKALFCNKFSDTTSYNNNLRCDYKPWIQLL